MARRIATCIRCLKWFRSSMDAYHGHAHLLQMLGLFQECPKTFLFLFNNRIQIRFGIKPYN